MKHKKLFRSVTALLAALAETLFLLTLVAETRLV